MWETFLFAAENDLDQNSFGPGLLGFLATFFLAIVLIFLIFNMVRRIRKVRYRAENPPTEKPKKL